MHPDVCFPLYAAMAQFEDFFDLPFDYLPPLELSLLIHHSEQTKYFSIAKAGVVKRVRRFDVWAWALLSY